MEPTLIILGETLSPKELLTNRLADDFNLDPLMPGVIDRFFNVGRLSLTGASPIGALPPILRQVRELSPAEAAIYTPWLELSAARIADQAIGRTQPEEARLRKIGDPLMLLLDYMFWYQRENLPGLSVDTKTMDKAKAHGAQVLRSLHGRRKH